MEPVLLFLVAQFALTMLGFAMLWRRLGALRGDIERLAHAVTLLEANASVAPRQVSKAVADGLSDVRVETKPPIAKPLAPARARAERAWRPRDADAPTFAARAIPLRRGAIVTIAVAPALGFVFGLEAALVAACGLLFAAALMLMAWRSDWVDAKWAAPAAAAAWALVAFAFRNDASDIAAAFALAGVGTAGLSHALRRDFRPGAALVAVAAVTALAMAAQSTLVGPIGASFGVLIVASAIIGAFSLRLEPLFVSAFIAALVGLYVLSGQPEAAIWFTPIAAWTGASFFAVAAVRTPILGPRGMTFAGIGALAPMASVTALYAAHHGLETPLVATLAYIGVGAALLGVLYWSTLKRRIDALGLTAWLLALSAGVCAAAAVALATPAHIAASAHAVIALLLMLVSARAPHMAWRLMACAFALFALVAALTAGDQLLRETSTAPAWATILIGWALPAALIFGAATQASRSGHDTIAASFEVLALGFAMGAFHLVARVAFAGESLLLEPLSFLEAGHHVAIWLAAALLAAWRAREPLRMGASLALSAGALGASALAALLWLSPFWTARGDPAPLGFLLPAFFAGAHWVFWRARGSTLRTHIAFAATALLSASALTLWVAQSGAPQWAGALLSALAFAGAIVVNFSPGVTQTRVDSFRRR